MMRRVKDSSEGVLQKCTNVYRRGYLFECIYHFFTWEVTYPFIKWLYEVIFIKIIYFVNSIEPIMKN